MAKKRFVRPEEVETLVFDWGKLKWMSEPRVTDAVRFSAGVVVVAPGEGHTRHNHPGIEEILYVLRGKGVQMVGDERAEIRAGDLVHIPPDIFHETMNTGREDLAILAIYAPPGPEAQLRALPGVKIVPPGEEA